MTFHGPAISSAPISGSPFYGPRITYERDWSPDQLFNLGEVGVWYDPSDLSTLFTDTAGTTPVTAAGDAVARINDKSGRGNHATQATLAARPIYAVVPRTGRRNLLTFTEQFDNAVWVKPAGTTVSADTDTAPDGTVSADTINSTGNQSLEFSMACIPSTTYTESVFIKKTVGAAYTPAFHMVFSGGTQIFYSVRLNTDTGEAFAMDVSGYTAPSGFAVADAGSYWRLSVSGASGNNTSITPRLYANLSAGSDAGAGSQVIWGAQLETGSTATAYQRVVSQHDVSEAGVEALHYLSFDGTDDSMVTGTITPGADKAQVFAGVRKLSDALTGTILDINGVIGTGAIMMRAPTGNASPNYAWYSSGDVAFSGIISPLSFAAPITNIVTGLSNIAADEQILRVNGAQVASSATDQGAGNYASLPLYIGRRQGAALPFNGHLYGAIVRFSAANLATAQIANAERWLARKSGVVLP
jgi:hypothetical protein